MKKHKFSDKLPEVGKTVLCQIWSKYTSLKENLAYGVFSVENFKYDRDKGIILIASLDFVYLHDEKAVPMSFQIYDNRELDDKLIWWADPEEEE
jgi:hypothetical protein